MKTSNIYIVLAIICSVLFASCSDFLDQGPESKIPGDRIFEDEKTTNGYIVGLYKEWKEGRKDLISTHLGIDESIAGGFQYMDNNDRKGVEGYGNTLNETNGIIRETWKKRYRVIARAAEAISYLEKNQETQSRLLNQYLGEACFFRAVCMWEISTLYGEVIMHDKNRPELEFARQSYDEIYKQIISDLEIAEKYLPDPSEVSDVSRFSKAVAQSILGKVYLYAPEKTGMRDYEKAAASFKKVIDNPYFGGKGAPTYSVIFDSYQQESTEYKKEIIYALQYKVGDPYNNATEWDFGSRAVAQKTPVEAMAPWAGFDGLLPSEYASTKVVNGGVWEEGDVRFAASIRTNFEWTDPKTKEHYVPDLSGWTWGDELEPHVKKYEDMRIVDKGFNSWHSGMNIPYLRFSDIVMCYAECLYFTGRGAEGINMINDIVRNRAFGGSLPADKRWNTGMSEDEFMEKLLDERMRELCFEGWRKFDLLRTGKLKEYVAKRNRWHKSSTWTNIEGTVKQTNGPLTIQDHKLLWPIPLDELKQNPGLSESDQNPGYEK